jgi:hypothetical protein
MAECEGAPALPRLSWTWRPWARIRWLARINKGASVELKTLGRLLGTQWLLDADVLVP